MGDLIFYLPGWRGNFYPTSLIFWQTDYNIPYHMKMGYTMTNIEYASPIPTPATYLLKRKIKIVT